MARQRRFCLPGYPQHVIQRGNNRAKMFADARDYRFYLATLADACDRFHCSVHAYVCMTNHVHLLMTPSVDTAISEVMQSLGRKYVQYFNWRHGRTGTLCEGRYRATIVDTDLYLLACYRYIELNPVRAGMVARPAGYPWSSYHCNGSGQPDPLVTEHPLYLELGADPPTRRRAYRALIDSGIPEPTVAEIRSATNKAWVLGGAQLRQLVETTLARPASPRPRGGDRRSMKGRSMGSDSIDCPQW